MTNRKTLSRANVSLAVFLFGTTLLASCNTVANDRENSLSLLTPDFAEMPAIGRVDERFQSYNVESVEVTGGNFWAPYPEPGETVEYDEGPHGTEFSTNAYQNREPIDLRGNQRLRMLTAALGPAYMRVSGTWANSIYFQDNDEPPMDPPEGYQGVLTREQWAGVVEFGKAVDAKILTSFATSDGARDETGAWNPDQARRLFAYRRLDKRRWHHSNPDACELIGQKDLLTERGINICPLPVRHWWTGSVRCSPLICGASGPAG